MPANHKSWLTGLQYRLSYVWYMYNKIFTSPRHINLYIIHIHVQQVINKEEGLSGLVMLVELLDFT